MPIERSAAIALAGFFFAIAFIVFPIQPSAAKDKMRGPETWGPIFRHQVERCWRKPVRAAGDTASMKAEVMIELTREGKLDGQPVLSSGSNSATSESARAYQQSALRAITDCQPYTLPAEYYDQWKKFMPVFTDTPLDRTGKPVSGELDTRKLSICRGC
ncbi:hypothetical protein [Bradyrhizobium sp. CCBAU 53421]|uniref:hypothetical protein n=1 Tax=Bradyrhizobium sp. CCBAU 53421 TaxID=1325120 RepID=UPI00188B7C2B|nr:hypothetical protein [Bradyrhizobium sp. CCBAU 53421]QOZ31317.1 hypothetical protein XH92_05895 [Bradyrhizobium sp. CCBAU 53421]